MFLKRILLQGFKSFADRTTFDFGPGLTGVVGPNGCGKSNVLDAIRWVLGEQSAKTLRGARMLDVIFSGSRSRKPANFCEVELTFDNASGLLPRDEREVTVARLLYRSGESEYRLNNKPCRLKDIRDLLLDTGVGVDAYSVIEQGRVDALLKANPLERREIFEEAAGISRYKVRRAEAQRRLERTQQNLLRLNDVIDELEKRLRSVKLAAGKARRFQEFDARLRELRGLYALAEYHELQQARAAHAAEVDAYTDLLAAKRADLAAHDAQASDLERELQSLDERIQALEAELLALQTEASAVEERVTQGQRRLVDLAESQRRHQNRAEQAAQRVELIRARAQQTEQELHELVAAGQGQAARAAELEQQRDAAGARGRALRDAVEQARGAAFEAARQASLLSNQQQHLQQQRARCQAQLAALQHRREQVERQLADTAARREAAAASAAELDERAARLAADCRSQDAASAALEVERDRQAVEVASRKETRSGLLSRLELLEDLERRQEGVDQGTRWALSWSDGASRPGGIVGLAADLMYIDDPRVALLQTILARFENHLVVREAHVFLTELIRRGEPPGPLAFLALDRLASPAAGVDYRDAVGFVARAVDWVRCEPAFRALVDRLLGRVVVVESVHAALGLAGEAPEGYVFVSLDGCTVESGGRVTIGAAKAVAGLIGRKSQIRQLRAELDELETALERGVRAQAELERRLSDLRLQREALWQQVAEAQQQHVEARNELLRLDDEAGRQQREQDVLAAEAADAQRTLEEIDRLLVRSSTEHQVAEQAHRTQLERIDACERELRETEAALAQHSHELTAARVELGRWAERRTACERALEELRSQHNALQREHEAARREGQETAAQIASTEVELGASGQRRAELQQRCGQGQAQVLAQRQARQGQRRRAEACGAIIRQLHGEIEAVESALRAQEVALREIEVRGENVVTRVREDLALDVAQLYAAYQHAERDWAAVEAEIAELRERIARLGNVNLDAIAELEELTPRYENLCAQRDDLNESIERLQALILELDQESRTRFLRAFQEIRAHFGELFRKLFGGGRADIVLEDPEQPLECGIEILAKPPGKETRTISLLSGGERTMAAVALLFAVFESKPSPFAILDEVDAALDESNIDRFNTVLHEFLERSQFVVITHNKRTMQCADVLYGITMEEPGVSKRVSVRFEDRVGTPNVA